MGKQYDAKQLIKRQLMSKTASKYQQITTATIQQEQMTTDTMCVVFCYFLSVYLV
jgi:hypothetical protein